MSLLPNGRLAALFIQAPMERVADCLTRWGNEPVVGRGTVATPRPGAGMDAGWEHVSQRAFIPYRAFLTPANGWTAFFDNHSREFLAQAELYVLCDRLAADTCFFRSAPDAHEYHFCHFRKAGGAVKERQVMVYQEGPWVFSAHGDPMPYEDLDAYRRPKKKDRLNEELLLTYASRIGVPLGASAALGPDIVLLQWKDFNKKK